VLGVGGFLVFRALRTSRQARYLAELTKAEAKKPVSETEDQRAARKLEQERQELAEETRLLREAEERAEREANKVRLEVESRIRERHERESTYEADKQRRAAERAEALEKAREDHTKEKKRVLSRLVKGAFRPAPRQLKAADCERRHGSGGTPPGAIVELSSSSTLAMTYGDDDGATGPAPWAVSPCWAV
jgi:hypothetical protein